MYTLGFRVIKADKRIESIYQEGEWEVLIRGPARAVRDALEYAHLSGRPRAYYLRRLARRVANHVGFTGQ